MGYSLFPKVSNFFETDSYIIDSLCDVETKLYNSLLITYKVSVFSAPCHITGVEFLF